MTSVNASPLALALVGLIFGPISVARAAAGRTTVPPTPAAAASETS